MRLLRSRVLCAPEDVVFPPRLARFARQSRRRRAPSVWGWGSWSECIHVKLAAPGCLDW